MSFNPNTGMTTFENNRKLQQKLGVVFKDKKDLYKYGKLQKAKNHQTEEEKQIARLKVQEEIRKQKKTQIAKFLIVLVIGTWLGTKLYFTFANSFQSLIYYH